MFFSEKNTKVDLQYLHLKIAEKLVEQVGTNCKEKYIKFTWGEHVEHICKKTC